MADQHDLLCVNGLDLTTGRPLTDPVSHEAFARRVVDAWTAERRDKEAGTFGPIRYGPFDEPDLDDLAQAGWGLLVHDDEADEAQNWLKDLIDHRGRQCDARLFRYKGEPAVEWIHQNHAEAINPDVFPYYLLIVGSPAAVPYELQFLLDARQAVGRLHFDTAEQYTRYAQSVVAQETGQAPVPGKRALFFAPRHPRLLDNGATYQSSEFLVRPLLEGVPQSTPGDVSFQSLIGQDAGQEATKANLLAALAAGEVGGAPALLFVASHGAGVKAHDPRQRALQGSIVCQDVKYPPEADKREGWIGGDDVGEGFRLPGGILFLFACYGAGTRKDSDFVAYVPEKRERENLEAYQGTEDFVAGLPRALLADPQGGALAVVGHVDPAWASAFSNPVTKDRRIRPFGRTLSRLLSGKPVGYAVKYFNEKYVLYNTDLLSLVESDLEAGQVPDPLDFSDLWICRTDAQNYVIIGDPAVRLAHLGPQ